MPRKSISKKTRFEVFKRDSFRCQYCGRGVPDVILEVDHLNPVAADGVNDVLNYVTSCFDCNRGKGPRKLDDQTVIAKSRAEVKLLLLRREQLDMVLESRRGFKDVLAEEVARIEAYFSERMNQGREALWGVSVTERKRFRKLIKQHGAPAVVDAIDRAAEAYLVNDAEGRATAVSWDRIIRCLGVFCDPTTRDLHYIRGILRNRLAHINEQDAMEMLRSATERGASVETLRALALVSTSWAGWIYDVARLGEDSTPENLYSPDRPEAVSA